MGDSRLSALNLNWFFLSSDVPSPKTTLRIHSNKQSLGSEMLLTNTPRKVRTLMLGFPFANNAEGIRSNQAMIPGKERQNFKFKTKS